MKREKVAFETQSQFCQNHIKLSFSHFIVQADTGTCARLAKDLMPNLNCQLCQTRRDDNLHFLFQNPYYFLNCNQSSTTVHNAYVFCIGQTSNLAQQQPQKVDRSLGRTYGSRNSSVKTIHTSDVTKTNKRSQSKDAL